MIITGLVIGIALLLVAGCASARQPETPAAITLKPTVPPTPARGPLDGKSINVRIAFVRMPEGIISEESESDIKDLILSLEPPANIVYHYHNNIRVGKYIEVYQVIAFPKEVNVYHVGLKYGFIWPGTPPEDDRIFNQFWFGQVFEIIHQNEQAVVARNDGYFLVGEEHIDLFWFLFEQLGKEKAIIVNTESYEEWWGRLREEWIYSQMVTPTPIIIKNPTAPPLPGGTLPPPLPSTAPPGVIPTKRDERSGIWRK